MKKLIIIAIGLIALSVGIYSCTKEQVKSTAGNQLKSAPAEPVLWSKVYVSKKKNKCEGCPISFGLCSPAKCGDNGEDADPIANPINDGTNTAYIKLTMLSSNVMRLKVDYAHSDPTTALTIFWGSHFPVDELDEEIDEINANQLGFNSVRLLPGNYPIQTVNGFKIIDFNVETN